MSKVHKVINELEKVSENIIKNSYIFDFYKNEKTKIVKLGCRFIFQSNHKTLSDIEINAKVQEILNPLLIMDGVSIPGMDINKPFK
jgi:phenylalanyl-tRNA synthetase beta subunit